MADAATRMYRVRVALPELPPAAHLGMTDSARFTAAADVDQTTALQLSLGTLFQHGDQPAAWVLPEGAAHLDAVPDDNPTFLA